MREGQEEKKGVLLNVNSLACCCIGCGVDDRGE